MVSLDLAAWTGGWLLDVSRMSAGNICFKLVTTARHAISDTGHGPRTFLAEGDDVRHGLI